MFIQCCAPLTHALHIGCLVSRESFHIEGPACSTRKELLELITRAEVDDVVVDWSKYAECGGDRSREYNASSLPSSDAGTNVYHLSRLRRCYTVGTRSELHIRAATVDLEELRRAVCGGFFANDATALQTFVTAEAEVLHRIQKVICAVLADREESRNDHNFAETTEFQPVVRLFLDGLLQHLQSDLTVENANKWPLKMKGELWQAPNKQSGSHTQGAQIVSKEFSGFTDLVFWGGGQGEERNMNSKQMDIGAQWSRFARALWELKVPRDVRTGGSAAQKDQTFFEGRALAEARAELGVYETFCTFLTDLFVTRLTVVTQDSGGMILQYALPAIQDRETTVLYTLFSCLPADCILSVVCSASTGIDQYCDSDDEMDGESRGRSESFDSEDDGSGGERKRDSEAASGGDGGGEDDSGGGGGGGGGGRGRGDSGAYSGGGGGGGSGAYSGGGAGGDRGGRSHENTSGMKSAADDSGGNGGEFSRSVTGQRRVRPMPAPSLDDVVLFCDENAEEERRYMVASHKSIEAAKARRRGLAYLDANALRSLAHVRRLDL